MTDVAREKYVRIMTEIDELEEALAAGGGAEKQSELDELRLKLTERMGELARITAACKKNPIKS
jgi:hypothetical protein